jgi:hypothetical protein
MSDTVLCEFCHNPLQFSHQENTKEIEVYDCRHCPVLTSFYYFEKDGTRIKTSYMLDRNEKVYIWTNNYITNSSYITDVGVSLSVQSDRNPLVVRFPKIMNINPTNVHEKFSFYMTFL